MKRLFIVLFLLASLSVFAQHTGGGQGGGGGAGGNNCGNPTCTVSTAGGGNGVLALSGNTSGTATLTAPAVAGTVNNAIISSNAIEVTAAGNSTNAAFAIGQANIGFFETAVSQLDVTVGGSNAWNFNTGDGFDMNPTWLVGWCSTSPATCTAGDTTLGRLSAGVISAGTGNSGANLSNGKFQANVYNFTGSTSGVATCTAPAVAGTASNGIVCSNGINAPGFIIPGTGGTQPSTVASIWSATPGNIVFYGAAGQQNMLINGSAIELDRNTNDSSGFLMISMTAPTISAGFGTSPSIVNGHNTLSFQINVGTGGTASTGTIGLPAAHAGWNCTCTDITTNSSTVFACKQTGAGTTTTAPIGEFTAAGAAQAWAASDIVNVSCKPF